MVAITKARKAQRRKRLGTNFPRPEALTAQRPLQPEGHESATAPSPSFKGQNNQCVGTTSLAYMSGLPAQGAFPKDHSITRCGLVGRVFPPKIAQGIPVGELHDADIPSGAANRPRPLFEAPATGGVASDTGPPSRRLSQVLSEESVGPLSFFRGAWPRGRTSCRETALLRRPSHGNDRG